MAIYLGFVYLGNIRGIKFEMATAVVAGAFGTSFIEVLRMRYERDFRWKRSPRYRKALRKSIADFKQIQADWGI